MKKLFLSLLAIMSFFAKAELVPIDKGVAVVFAQEGPVIITKSDIDRPSLDGVYKNIDDVILEQLMLQDAKKYKIEVSEDAIDKYLQAIQREHGLSPKDFKKMFAEAGYTLEEGRQQIGQMFAVNELIGFKIRSRLIIPEKEVRAYYDAHPVVQEASARVKHGIVSFDEKIGKEAQKENIEKRIRAGKRVKGVKWGLPFWVKQSETDRQYIFDVDPKKISNPVEIADGFELYHILEQKPEFLVPLSDRYNEIADLLLKPKYEKLYTAFKAELFGSSSIVRF